MVNGPLYGNIFQEAALFEERFEEYDRAINILNKGLDANSRYGPLWLTLIRVLEKVAKGNLTKTRETIDKAIKSTPKVCRFCYFVQCSRSFQRKQLTYFH
jgi:hypothetical protein